MSTRTIATTVFAVFVIVVLVIIILYQYNVFSPKTSETVETPVKQEKLREASPESKMNVDRIQIIEDALSDLKKEQDDQEDLLIDLSEKVNDLSTASASLANKTILDIKQSQGAVFSTTSTGYSSMGTFVNVVCPKSCILWINYYSSSKNNAANNTNTYGIFVNGQDKGIYSQAHIASAGGSAPIALNASIPAGAGTYTVEIKSKTSGGTLQSDISFLQVMAIEQ